jgi:transcriptional regulator GlxA family with amidase domain
VQQFRVGILLFNEVEVLDFAGPFEVFSLATHPGCNVKLFTVKTVAQTKEIIKARNGLQVVPDLSFDEKPEFDILIIPGGYGAERIEINNTILLDWLREQLGYVDIMASVCTGAFLLAEAGLLNDKEATTHWMDIDRLEQEFARIRVKRNVKFVDQGQIITAGGISAGINMSFHIISRLVGKDVSRFTAKRMEYDLEI